MEIPYSKNEWFHWCGVFNMTSTQVYSYINGTASGLPQPPGPGMDIVSIGPMILGDAFIIPAPSHRTGNCTIDELIIMEQPLPAGDVWDMYQWYK